MLTLSPSPPHSLPNCTIPPVHPLPASVRAPAEHLSRYSDDLCEYRHVQLPKPMLKKIPKDLFNPASGTLKLLHESEWRDIGITQSLGWQHYEIHQPEPHILLFKRPINYQPPGQGGV